MRAAVELARADQHGAGRRQPVKGHQLSTAQDIPRKFLEAILSELKRAGLVASQRGAEGGYWLARPAEEITVADVIRAVEGPLADVRGVRAEALDYDEDDQALQRMWIALRANLRAVLEGVTLADLRSQRLDPRIEALADDPDAWTAH